MKLTEILGRLKALENNLVGNVLVGAYRNRIALDLAHQIIDSFAAKSVALAIADVRPQTLAEKRAQIEKDLAEARVRQAMAKFDSDFAEGLRKNASSITGAVAALDPAFGKSEQVAATHKPVKFSKVCNCAHCITGREQVMDNQAKTITRQRKEITDLQHNLACRAELMNHIRTVSVRRKTALIKQYAEIDRLRRALDTKEQQITNQLGIIIELRNKLMVNKVSAAIGKKAAERFIPKRSRPLPVVGCECPICESRREERQSDQ